MTSGVARALKVTCGVVGVFLAALGLWLFLYARPQLHRYQVLIAFETRPTAEQREQTLRLLRARVRQFARASWRAELVPQPDGGILLLYAKTGGPGDLAESVVPRGACEFRFLDTDGDHLQAALKNGAPEGFELLNYFETCDGYDVNTGEPIRRLYPRLVEKAPVLAPQSFKNVMFWTEGFAKYTHLRFEFLPGDAKQVVRLSETHSGRALALVVDGFIRVTMRVGPRSESGVIEISALLDNAEIEKLVHVIRNGPLPCPVRIKQRWSRVLE